MDIEKLKKHLENTSLKDLRQEWRQTMKYANVGPKAIYLIKQWKNEFTI